MIKEILGFMINYYLTRQTKYLFYIYYHSCTKSFLGQPVVVFRADRKTSTDPDETFTGSLLSFEELYKWAQEKCIPLVREITFENAEELTEEGLPFLILFHHPNDNESVKKYKEVIQNELEGEKRKLL